MRNFLNEGGSNTIEGNLLRIDRLRFAYRISAAIFYAQGAGLAHKIVMPDSTLVFEESLEGSSSGRATWMPFLTSWTLARNDETCLIDEVMNIGKKTSTVILEGRVCMWRRGIMLATTSIALGCAY